MKGLVLSAAAALAVLVAGAARAEPYVDYTPLKGAWHVITVKVDPNHIDDYVTGLKKHWAAAEEIAKSHGLIDNYRILVKLNASDGQGNLLLIEHIPNLALLEPDQARDQAIEKEIYAAEPKADGEAAVKEFDKYRSFVGDDYWSELTFTK